jgi:hypothetical protein
MTFDHAKRVKDRHERELLMHDFVQGVGIGEDHGEPTILVYVHYSPRRPNESLPDRLEDVPVVVEESGLFQTF